MAGAGWIRTPCRGRWRARAFQPCRCERRCTNHGRWNSGCSTPVPAWVFRLSWVHPRGYWWRYARLSTWRIRHRCGHSRQSWVRRSHIAVRCKRPNCSRNSKSRCHRQRQVLASDLPPSNYPLSLALQSISTKQCSSVPGFWYAIGKSETLTTSSTHIILCSTT